MKRGRLYSVCILALFIWNCPKRQTARRIVYEPPPPPAAAVTSSGTIETLLIAEPQPPEPEVVPAPEEPTPEEKPPAKRSPRPVRTEAVDPTPEAEPPPALEVPTLEPRESPDQQAAQRQEVSNLQAQVRNRLARLERSSLAPEERRMAEDARTFLSQSERALAGNDFQRAMILARKASMLVAVVEQQ